MIGEILRGLRDIMVLAEKLDNTTELAKQADRRSIELGERMARVEAVLDYALHGIGPRETSSPATLPSPSSG